VLEAVNLRSGEPEVVAIAGPNGAGKSTLVNVMAGVWTDYSGQCLCDGREVRSWDRREFARLVSHVPQQLMVSLPFTAREVVVTGRTPHTASGFESEGDLQAVARAMRITGTTELASRRFATLSGGERQRVILAAALAQEPRALLLDEPTAFLDVRHQVGVWQILRDLCSDGLTAIVVTHDLNLAASFADRLVLLARGCIVADAAPDAAMHPELLSDVFQVRVAVHRTDDGQRWVRYGA
jgi:iron complex transport system ATP-binding protein